MVIKFSDKDHFMSWISDNVKSHEGIWIRFFRDKNKKSLTADEALDVALCFGWIDGQMKTEDEKSYIKYFAPRTKNSKWSEKNKEIVERLRKEKRMTDHGEEAVRRAVENGQWNKEKTEPDFNKLISEFEKVIGADEAVASKFKKVSPSLKKRYCFFYFEAKTDETRKKRLGKIIDALNERNKGMLY